VKANGKVAAAEERGGSFLSSEGDRKEEKAGLQLEVGRAGSAA
jgi:hypothetical protein